MYLWFPSLLWVGIGIRIKDTCNDDEHDVVIRPASVPWLVNNMMVIVSCCVGGHCYFSPSRDDGHVFDRANH